MSALVGVDCDRPECLTGWSSDYLDGEDTSTVKGAFEYLADMDGWVRVGALIYCSTECAGNPLSSNVEIGGQP